MRSHRISKRDVALTTLIDLLVQIVFVLALLLVATGTLVSLSSTVPVPEEPWKTLINIFNVDPKMGAAQQASEIAKKYEAIVAKLKRETGELEKTKRENERLRREILLLDSRIADLSKKTGGSGISICRDSDGLTLLVVASVQIDVGGRIKVTPRTGALDFRSLGLSMDESSDYLSREEFLRRFSMWREHGLRRSPPCKYGAVITYDPKAIAGDYQPSYASILNIFGFQGIAKIQ